MDVNQTRFHLVFGKNDWFPQAMAGLPGSLADFVSWNDADATIQLEKKLFLFPRPANQTLLDISQRRGAGIDRYGNWYWIDETRTELRFLGNTRTASEHFWSSADELKRSTRKKTQAETFAPVEPPAPESLVMSGLSVTSNHYLVVGLTIPKGLLIFDLHAGGPPLEYHWPADVPFAPFDLAPSTDGGAWILDRTNKLYWKLDAMLRVRPAAKNEAISAAQSPLFLPADGSAAPACGVSDQVPLTIDLAAPIVANDPVALEALPDGSIMILDNPTGADYSVLLHYSTGQLASPPFSLSGILQQYISVLDSTTAADLSDSVRGHDIAYVDSGSSAGTQLSGLLYVASSDGDQSFAFDLSQTSNGFSLSLAERFFPMRFYTGKALAATSTNAFYDIGDRWVGLAEQPRPRFASSTTLSLPVPRSQSDADAGTAAFDGKQTGCVWHRVFLDASIPPGTQVIIESRAADLVRSLPDLPWQPEPTPYLRDDGSEIPFYKVPLHGACNRTGTWELLLQRATGRYLQLRMTLSGPGSSSPKIQAVRVYYGRFSYLKKYLPSAYQDDPGSAWFLDRFLANVEGFFTVDEGRIVRTPYLFDTRTVPAEYMDWLASWLGLMLDLSWDERKRRIFLSHAPQIYRERGTKAGLEHLIRLTLESCPDDSLFDESDCDCAACAIQSRRGTFFSVRVVEKFLTRQAPGLSFTSVSGSPTPGTADPSQGWTAAFGSNTLDQDFRNYLSTTYGSLDALNAKWSSSFTGFDDPALKFFATAPANKAQATDWKSFLTRQLSFTYVPPASGDLKLFQDFLRSRYLTIGALNTSYQLSGSLAIGSFANIDFPAYPPAGGRALEDWLEFVSSILPTQRFAHQFTVLVPVQLGDDNATQSQKMDIARRIAQLQKPAHTSFDVQPYWAFFRAGAARLGIDTLLGRGSRFSALLLGRDSLADSYLAYIEPWNVSDRTVLGGTRTNACCSKQQQTRCI